MLRRWRGERGPFGAPAQERVGPLGGSGARTRDRQPRALREPPASMGEGDRELDKVALGSSASPRLGTDWV